jgi:hypothetical protein
MDYIGISLMIGTIQLGDEVMDLRVNHPRSFSEEYCRVNKKDENSNEFGDLLAKKSKESKENQEGAQKSVKEKGWKELTIDADSYRACINGVPVYNDLINTWLVNKDYVVKVKKEQTDNSCCQI